VNGPVQIEQGEAPAIPEKKLPPRLYVDLSPCRPLRRFSLRAFSLQNDRRVRSLRVARNTLRVTRVVLDLHRIDHFRVTALTSPYRVVLDLAEKKLPPRPQTAMPLPRRVPRLLSRGRGVRWPGGVRPPSTQRGSPLPASSRPGKRPYVLRYNGPLRLPFPLSVQRIAVDPGHGGREKGAVGRDTGLKEKDVTLDIARHVALGLRRKLGVEAFLTRKKDRYLSISQRALLVRKKKADLLLSIHSNAHVQRRIRGITTYFLNLDDRFYAARLLASDPLVARENQGVDPRKFGDVSFILNDLKARTNMVTSRLLAVAIQRGLVGGLQRNYRRVRDLGVRRGLFYVLFAAGVPGVLVEASFISNGEEERRLASPVYRRKVAKGIVRGMGLFLQAARRPKNPPLTRTVP
jgi:N-acetylmuramoyl-L-alanine amidase